MDRRRQSRFAVTFVGTLLMVAGTGIAATQDGPGLGPLVLPEGVGTSESPPVNRPAVAAEAPMGPVAPVVQAETPVQAPTPITEPITEPVTEPVGATTPPLADTEPVASSAAPASADAVDPLFPLPATETPAVESRWSEKALPGAGTAPKAGELGISGEGASEALEVGASLAGVILLIWVLRYMIRRSRGETAGSRLLAGGRAPSGVASILARYPVARGQQVVLLEVGRRILVTHQSAGTMTTLSEITDPEELADLRARIAGVDRTVREQPFDSALSSSLEKTPTRDALSTVEGLPGLVAETVDLTRSRPRARRFSGGAA